MGKPSACPQSPPWRRPSTCLQSPPHCRRRYACSQSTHFTGQVLHVPGFSYGPNSVQFLGILTFLTLSHSTCFHRPTFPPSTPCYQAFPCHECHHRRSSSMVQHWQMLHRRRFKLSECSRISRSHFKCFVLFFNASRLFSV